MEPKSNEERLEGKIHKIIPKAEKDLPAEKSKIAKIAGVIKTLATGIKKYKRRFC